MYTNLVKSQNEALCHLLFHCCLKDGRFSEGEIDKVSEIFVQYDLQHDLNFTEEVKKYRGYTHEIVDEQAFVNYMLQLIMPVNELALYSWCLELMLSDDSLSLEEEALLEKVSSKLVIDNAEAETIKKLVVQRRVVMNEHIC